MTTGFRDLISLSNIMYGNLINRELDYRRRYILMFVQKKINCSRHAKLQSISETYLGQDSQEVGVGLKCSFKITSFSHSNCIRDKIKNVDIIIILPTFSICQIVSNFASIKYLLHATVRILQSPLFGYFHTELKISI